MGKLALNFICKDESHVIEKMLESNKTKTFATETDGTKVMHQNLPL